MAEISAVAVRGGEDAAAENKNSGSSGKTTPTEKQTREHRRNYFIARPPTSETPTVTREGEQRTPLSEWIKFREVTYDEHRRLMDNWAANMVFAYWKPGGKKLLEGAPDQFELFSRVLDADKGYDSDELRHKVIIGNIDRMLQTPEGWVRARGLLDQTTAEGLFALGLSVSAQLQEKNINATEIFSDNQPGWFRRRARRVGAFARRHPVGRTVAGGVVGAAVGQAVRGGQTYHGLQEAGRFLVEHAHYIPHTPADIGTAVGTAAGAGIAWFMARGDGEQTEASRQAFIASRDALLSIQNDAGRAARVKALWHIDVNDFIIDEDSQTIRMRENVESSAKISDVLKGVRANMAARRHYLVDIGVPEDEIDALPESFILQNAPDQYERTGERLYQDIIERYHQLKKERPRRTPDVQEPDEQTKRDLLLKDTNGRDLTDVLRGRDYPKDVKLPDYRVDGVLQNRFDIWGQNPNSDWYKRVDEHTITLLGVEGIKINGSHPGEDQLIDRLTQVPGVGRIAERFLPEDRGRAPLRQKIQQNPDGSYRLLPGQYEYEMHNNGERMEIPQNRIFYIDANGNRQLLESVRTFNETTGAFDYSPGFTEDEVAKNTFYIPTDGTPPIPFAMITFGGTRSVTTGAWENTDLYVCHEGRMATVDIADRHLRSVTHADRAHNTADVSGVSVTAIAADNANLEPFYRDQEGHAPLGDIITEQDAFGNIIRRYYDPQRSEAPVFGRTREAYRHENLLNLFPPGTEINTELSNEGLRGIIGAIETGQLPLRGELHYQDFVDYFHGDSVSPRAQELLSAAFPVKDIIFGEVLPVNNQAFLARDSAGRSPADIRFGITDPDMLAALNALLPADIVHFDYRTGLDRWKQGPGDPFFCQADGTHFEVPPGSGIFVNLHEKIDLDSIVIDQWGQPKLIDGEQNPFFMVQNLAEVADPNVATNLELFIQAREMVLSDVTEDLIVQMRRIPPRNITTIDTKIVDREEGGKVHDARTEQARRDGEAWKELRNTFESRQAKAEAYEQAKRQKAANEKDLEKFIQEKFGRTITFSDKDELQALKSELGQFINGYADLRVKVGRRIEPLGALGSREDQTEARKEDALAAIDALTPETAEAIRDPQTGQDRSPTIDELDAIKDRRKQRAMSDYNTALSEIDRQKRMVSELYGDLDQRLIVLGEQEEALSRNGAVALGRREVMFMREEAIATAAELASTAHPEVKDILLTAIPDVIMKKINELHANHPEFGWGPEANNDFDKQQMLLYAMTFEKATQENGVAVLEFVTDPTLKTIIANDITYEQIENLEERQLLDLLREQGITTYKAMVNDEEVDQPFNEDKVKDIKRILREYVRDMTHSTRLLKEEFYLRVERSERNAGKDEKSEEEIETLEVTKDLMERLPTVFGSTALFMSGVDTFLPIEGTRSRTMGDAVADDVEKREYTKAEQDLGNDTPLGYYEIMDVLFNYKDKSRSDKEAYFKKISTVIPVQTLCEVMRKSAKQLGLPSSIHNSPDAGKLFFALQENIMKGRVTRRALRQMFVSVIDTVEARAMAMQ